jgi:hypothetical protein
MAYIDQDQLAVEIARSFISQAAPQELPLFEGISAEYLKNPKQVLTQKSGKEELLGFGGAGEAVLLLSPIALGVVTNILNSLTMKTAQSIGTKAWQLIRNFFKGLRAEREKERKELPSLTQEQLIQVRDQIFLAACGFKLSKERAGLLAEAVVGKLATLTEDTSK